jgi:hypothetical protein
VLRGLDDSECCKRERAKLPVPALAFSPNSFSSPETPVPSSSAFLAASSQAWCTKEEAFACVEQMEASGVVIDTRRIKCVQARTQVISSALEAAFVRSTKETSQEQVVAFNELAAAKASWLQGVELTFFPRGSLTSCSLASSSRDWISASDMLVGC